MTNAANTATKFETARAECNRMILAAAAKSATAAIETGSKSCRAYFLATRTAKSLAAALVHDLAADNMHTTADALLIDFRAWFSN